MQKSSLKINGFELPVCLGWPEAERQQAQTVRVDFDIQFATPPIACDTDQLQDTFCYDKVLNHVREKVLEHEFRLIEHLAIEIYRITKPLLPSTALLTVHVLKFPAIPGLTGGVTFTYSD